MALAEQEVLREIYVPIVYPAALDNPFSRVSEAARSRVPDGFRVEPPVDGPFAAAQIRIPQNVWASTRIEDIEISRGEVRAHVGSPDRRDLPSAQQESRGRMDVLQQRRLLHGAKVQLMWTIKHGRGSLVTRVHSPS